MLKSSAGASGCVKYLEWKHQQVLQQTHGLVQTQHEQLQAGARLAEEHGDGDDAHLAHHLIHLPVVAFGGVGSGDRLERHATHVSHDPLREAAELGHARAAELRKRVHGIWYLVHLPFLRPSHEATSGIKGKKKPHWNAFAVSSADVPLRPADVPGAR